MGNAYLGSKATMGLCQPLIAMMPPHSVYIQGQFLVEAVILSLLGGCFGTLLGIGGTWVTCLVTGWTFSVSATSAALGVGVASGIGIFFGFYPAYQAARLDPIIALRSSPEG